MPSAFLAVVVQEGLVPFDIGVPISGDVAIGLWFGAYNLGQRLHSRPAAAYAFHTAFFEENKVTPFPACRSGHAKACTASWITRRIEYIPRSILRLQAMVVLILVAIINSAADCQCAALLMQLGWL